MPWGTPCVALCGVIYVCCSSNEDIETKDTQHVGRLFRRCSALPHAVCTHLELGQPAFGGGLKICKTPSLGSTSQPSLCSHMRFCHNAKVQCHWRGDEREMRRSAPRAGTCPRWRRRGGTRPCPPTARSGCTCRTGKSCGCAASSRSRATRGSGWSRLSCRSAPPPLTSPWAPRASRGIA